MIKFLIRTMIPDYQRTTNSRVREAYGVLAGIVGIINNFLLFGAKLTAGLMTGSIAIISDAFNNLTDLGSTVVAIYGAKMSNRPPDKDHPQGHGRYEYIASLVVAFIIFMVGLELLRNAWDKIVHPAPIQTNVLTMVILLGSVLVKLWMFSYNIYISRQINSAINRATAYDSLSDTLATGSVILTSILARFTSLPLDGMAGFLISLLILYSGFKIAKDTVDLLLGKAADPQITRRISEIVNAGEHIIGTHDLIVHDYGPNRVIASIHAEVSDQLNIVEGHTSIDQIEHQIIKELGIEIIVHLDPVCTDLRLTEIARGRVEACLKASELPHGINHFRLAQVKEKTVVIFEVAEQQGLSAYDFDQLRLKIKQTVERAIPEFEVVVNHRGHNL